MTTIRKLVPPFAPCVECGHEYSGTHCPICKAEHPTFTAVKNVLDRERELLRVVRLAGETCCEGC